MMKKSLMKRVFAVALVLAMVFALCACGGAKFSVTQTPKKMTIKINEAKQDDFIETSMFEVGKNYETEIDAELESGEVLIEFCECIYMSSAEDDDSKYLPGDVIYSVTVSGDDDQDLDVAPEQYVIRVTAQSDTTGTVVIQTEKD